MAQSVKCLPLDFGSVISPWFMRWSPVLGSALIVQACLGFSASLSPSPTHTHVLSRSLSKINKHFLKSEGRHPCLPDFGGKVLSFSLLIMMLAMEFLYTALMSLTL